MATEKQLEANRRNALKSTGPRSKEGKAGSRANAFKHGMTSDIVLPEDDRAAKIERYQEWVDAIVIDNQLQSYQLSLAVSASMKVDVASQAIEERRQELADLAKSNERDWKLQKLIEVGTLANRMKRDPRTTVAQLKLSPTGRRWLIDEWKELLMAVPDGQIENFMNWTEEESNRFLDLMGEPKTLRVIKIRKGPFRNYNELKRLILAQIEQLEADCVRDDEQNAKLKALDIKGLNLEDRSIRLYLRYERESYRKMERALDRIDHLKAMQRAEQQQTDDESDESPLSLPSDDDDVAETHSTTEGSHNALVRHFSSERSADLQTLTHEESLPETNSISDPSGTETNPISDPQVTETNPISDSQVTETNPISGQERTETKPIPRAIEAKTKPIAVQIKNAKPIQGLSWFDRKILIGHVGHAGHASYGSEYVTDLPLTITPTKRPANTPHLTKQQRKEMKKRAKRKEMR